MIETIKQAYEKLYRPYDIKMYNILSGNDPDVTDINGNIIEKGTSYYEVTFLKESFAFTLLFRCNDNVEKQMIDAMAKHKNRS